MGNPPDQVEPLDQTGRPPPSLPMDDADLKAGNANWTKGLQVMSDWIWSGHLNPEAFPNNLGRFFLHVPGIFEQQLSYSTTLIFDEPSFKNGVQISGFLDRVARELAISYTAQRRRSWYSMTHHAILGRLTATKHGLSAQHYTNKWSNLLRFREASEHYSRVELAVLAFAEAFNADPKAYTDAKYTELREALAEHNRQQHAATGGWQEKLAAAKAARAKALAELRSPEQAEIDARSKAAFDAAGTVLSDDLNARLIDAQVVELAFICLQFVSLTCAFTGLNIPDEDFLADTMKDLVPGPVIARINALNEAGGEGLESLVPPPVELPLDAVRDGRVIVEPAPLKGARIPLRPYEDPEHVDRDKGLTVGGVNVGVWGWGFGAHFPGSLVYCLMHHPELARFEAPYSLPVLFNEDEWRNGVQTAGYTTRRLKEIVIQKVYKLNRSRYGIEHHAMFLYNTYLDEHGVGRPPKPDLSEAEAKAARDEALARAEAALLDMLDHNAAPKGTYSELEKAAMSWTEALVTAPHAAYRLEPPLRTALRAENEREIDAGLRILDGSPDLDEPAALERLENHQIAELAQMVGHMDGLGRAMTILRLEAEGAAHPVAGSHGPSGGIVPETDSDGQVKLTGAFNPRPALHDVLRFTGMSPAALTFNELMVNPRLARDLERRMKDGKKPLVIRAEKAAQTGEF